MWIARLCLGLTQRILWLYYCGTSSANTSFCSFFLLYGHYPLNNLLRLGTWLVEVCYGSLFARRICIKIKNGFIKDLSNCLKQDSMKIMTSVERLRGRGQYMFKVESRIWSDLCLFLHFINNVRLKLNFSFFSMSCIAVIVFRIHGRFGLSFHSIRSCWGKPEFSKPFSSEKSMNKIFLTETLEYWTFEVKLIMKTSLLYLNREHYTNT